MRRHPSTLRQLAAVVCLFALVACSALCQSPPLEKPKAHECCKRKAGAPAHVPDAPAEETHCKPQPWDVRKEAPLVAATLLPVEVAWLQPVPKVDWHAEASGHGPRALDDLHLRNRVLRI